MSDSQKLSSVDRGYLRDLARKYLSYANLPVMAERRQLWLDHNGLRGKRPPIVMETWGFGNEMHPVPRLSGLAGDLESQMLTSMAIHDHVNDDKLIPPYLLVGWHINYKNFDLDIGTVSGKDSEGRELGHVFRHPITDLKRDFGVLKPSTFSVNKEASLAGKALAEELLGDILPIRMANGSLQWFVTPSAKIIMLMGMEHLMIALMDYPEDVTRLYQFLHDDMLAFIDWQEREGLLILNNGADYIGSGSVGLTDELPRTEEGKAGRPMKKDLWLNMNSQETVSISSGMYGEFVFPCYEDIARQFGLVYYGCCEPVHPIWDKYISKLPNLRKVSISAWCNEEFMGDRLRGGKVIYSRKPSPTFLGVGDFNPDAFREHISQTLRAAAGCHLEFIFRDIYTLSGDLTKPARAVTIVRELINELWS